MLNDYLQFASSSFAEKTEKFNMAELILGSIDKYENKNVSTIEPINEDVNGATNHFFILNWSKIWTSSNWAIIKAVPEPIAILTEIKSE